MNLADVENAVNRVAESGAKLDKLGNPVDGLFDLEDARQAAVEAGLAATDVARVLQAIVGLPEVRAAIARTR